MITDRRKEIHYENNPPWYFYFPFLPLESIQSIPWPVHIVQETSPNFLRLPTWVDNTADNAAITQSQTANHHRLLSHVTLGLVVCGK